jgi:hypothetical protein
MVGMMASRKDFRLKTGSAKLENQQRRDAFDRSNELLYSMARAGTITTVPR